jgi:hypothetical protein
VVSIALCGQAADNAGRGSFPTAREPEQVATPDPIAELAPLQCARCAAALQPGSGNFYRITIEAVADPSPPLLPALDLADIRRQIEQTLARLQDMTEQEALAQVIRRLEFHLCGPCYRRWIENPTGTASPELGLSIPSSEVPERPAEPGE